VPDLAIGAGKVTALLGPNGSGKSTLLNILAFLDAPTEGAVEFFGKPARHSHKELLALRRQVVLAHQNPVLFTTTVKKNVEFGLKVRGVPKAERERRAGEALDLVGMRGFINAKAHRLSGGETQRVVMAQALALDAPVLLCDEPAASVDAENRRVLLSLLERVCKEKGVTVVVTSHDMPWARSLAHTTVWLEDGAPVSAPQSCP
jgi:tungstate transport system ATP-binding protein